MRRKELSAALLIGAVTFFLYFPVRKHDFIRFDDPVLTTENPYINRGLSWSSFCWAFTNPVLANWHPVTTLSHMLDCQLFGLMPGPPHLVNAGLHAVNAMLLFVLLSQMTGALWRSAAAAALFSLHPLRVESVAWIAERKDVLSGFFFLLTLLAYGSYVKWRMQSAECRMGDEKSKVQDPKSKVGTPTGQSRPETRKSSGHACSALPSTPYLRRWTGFARRWTSDFRLWTYYGLALVLFACGLMSKPMLVTLPFVLLLLDFWPLGRFEPGVAAEVTRLKLQRGPCRFPPGSRKDKHKKQDKSLVTPAATTTKVESRETRHAKLSPSPALLEKIPFFVLAMISSILTLHFQHRSGAMPPALPLMDRFANAALSYWQYMAKTFWPANLSVFYPHPASRFYDYQHWIGPQIWLAALFVIVITAASIVSIRRKPYLAVGWFWFIGTLVPVIGIVQVGNQAFADRYTYIPSIGLMMALAWLAAEIFSRLPGRAILFGVVAAILIIVCAIHTRTQLHYWSNTITLFNHALRVIPGNPIAEYSLGIAWEDKANTNEASLHYEAALAVDPLYKEAHYNYGHMLKNGGRLDAAKEQFEAAARCRPEDSASHLSLGNVLLALHQRHEAAQQLEQALRIEPDSIEGLNNLAWILATSRDADLRNGPRAVQLAERACELSHFNQTTLVGTLAAAYAEDGRLPEAIATAEKACTLAAQSGQTSLLQKNQQLLDLYRSRKAYRETE